MLDLPPAEPSLPSEGGRPPSGRRGTEVARRYAPALILVLSIAALVSQSLAISAMKLQPRYDEVAYMAVARNYQREGGIVGTIRCHLDGRCQEDNRSPLFEMALQTVANDTPGFYPIAKLFTLGTALMLGLLGFWAARRLFGPTVAVGVIAVWCLMPSMGELSSRVLADLFYAALILATVYAIAACQGAGILAWLGAGAMIGLTYLTKGNGHLLFPVLICVGLHHHGRALIRRWEPYAAVLGFLVVTAFLLRRNMIVSHNPFHNYNDRLLWLDNWEESWEFLRDPEKRAVGLRFFLKRHSIWTIALRGIKGLGHTIGVTIYSAGVGLTSLKQPEAKMTIATAIQRVVTGLGVIALAIFGLRRRLATPVRLQALAVIYTLAWFMAAFAIGQQGAGEIGVRYVMPLVVLLTPYAVDFTLVAAWPRLKRRLAGATSWLAAPGTADTAAILALVAALAIKLAWFAPQAAKDPRSFVDVPPAWDDTSRWFAANLAPGERYAFPYTSLYSTFDQPFPEPDQRWIYLYRLDPALMRRDLDRGLPASIDASLVAPPGPINKVFVDAEDALLSSYRDKFSPATDAHGPLAFLGWPRCFADRQLPSRFLVFCRTATR